MTCPDDTPNTTPTPCSTPHHYSTVCHKLLACLQKHKKVLFLHMFQDVLLQELEHCHTEVHLHTHGEMNTNIFNNLHRKQTLLLGNFPWEQCVVCMCLCVRLCAHAVCVSACVNAKHVQLHSRSCLGDEVTRMLTPPLPLGYVEHANEMLHITIPRNEIIP